MLGEVGLDLVGLALEAEHDLLRYELLEVLDNEVLSLAGYIFFKEVLKTLDVVVVLLKRVLQVEHPFLVGSCELAELFLLDLAALQLVNLALDVILRDCEVGQLVLQVQDMLFVTAKRVRSLLVF